MTDGPVKNAKLNGRWKRVLEAAGNSAVERDQRDAMTSDALLADIMSGECSPVVGELAAYAAQAQLELDAVGATASIFARHAKSPFLDTLQKHLASTLSQPLLPKVALDKALDRAMEDQVDISKSRVAEECLRLRDTGAMRQEEADRIVEQTRASLDRLDREKLRNAIRSGQRGAFKALAAKRSGVDQGPKKE